MHVTDAIVWGGWILIGYLGKLMSRLSEPTWVSRHTNKQHRRKERTAQERQQVLDTQARLRGEVVPERDPNQKLYTPKPRGGQTKPHRSVPKPSATNWMIPPPVKSKSEETGQYVSSSEEAPPMPGYHNSAR